MVDLDPVLHGRFFPIGEDVDRPFDLAQDARELVARFKQDIGVRAANLHLDHKVPRRNGVPDPLNRTEPIKKPILSDKLLKLAGAMPY